MRTILRELSSNRRGSLVAEFAAAMPVMVLLLLGGIEISRFALLNQKMDRLATTMGDLVAQAETLSTAELDQLFLAASHVASPFDVQGNGTVIISSISVPTGLAEERIVWQRRTGSLNDSRTCRATWRPARSRRSLPQRSITNSSRC